MSNFSGKASIPPLVFTVAVTGHRDIPVARHGDLQTAITGLLDYMRDQLLNSMAASELDATRALTCRFISALAPGADQIGARAALATAHRTPHWQLYAVLPFAQPIYTQLAAEALRDHELTQADIAAAVAAIGKLADKADRVLELADWQPGAASPLTRDWQSRRYATLGQLLVRQADLLIALWDGNPTSGLGGTADVVSEARRSGVPVIWVDLEPGGGAHSLVPDPASNHLAACDLVAGWRREAEAHDPLADPQQATIARAAKAVGTAISHVLLGNDPARAICVRRYLDEPPAELWAENRRSGDAHPGDSHIAYAHMLYRFLNWPPKVRRQLSPEEVAADIVPPALRGKPFGFAWRQGKFRWARVLLYPFDFGVARGEPGTANAAPLLDHAERADALATRLSNQYRSAYVKIFALAPVAVMCAVLSVLPPKEWLPTMMPKDWATPILENWKVLLVTAELATVLWAAGIYLRTRGYDPVVGETAKPRWWHKPFPPQDTHQRWLDARLIADSQRGGQLLAWVGFSGRRPLEDTAPHHQPDDGDAQDHGHGSGHAAPRTVWAPHYANAIAALPELPLDEAAGSKRATITPSRVAALARAAGKLIGHQLGYHDLNHQRLQALNHRLDSFSLGAIIAALIASLIYLALWLVKQDAPSFAPWLGVMDHHSMMYDVHHFLYTNMKYVAAFAGAVLPAVAAAAAGIRFQGDFERFAMRSKDTAARLTAFAERARDLEARATACGAAACINEAPLFESLLALLVETQSVLDEDLADWRFAYAARPITLG